MYLNKKKRTYLTMNGIEFLKSSDISAALVGAGFSTAYAMPGSPAMQAVQSAVVSIVARVVASSKMLAAVTPVGVTGDQKNQIVVAALSAAVGYYKRHGLLKSALTGVSIDLLSQEVLTVLNMTDMNIVGGIKATGGSDATGKGV